MKGTKDMETNDTRVLHRTNDPETSIEAAEGVDTNASEREVRRLLEFGPSSDHELVSLHDRRYYKVEAIAGRHAFRHYTAQRIRSARAALVARGEVEFAGYYHQTPTGGRTRVWQLVDGAA